MIRNYSNRLTEAVADGTVKKGFPSDLIWRAQMMLTLLDNAVELDDLRSPPGNHLEALSGNRKGQHSVRINKQFRICFVWTATGPEDVEITDYH